MRAATHFFFVTRQFTQPRLATIRAPPFMTTWMRAAS
jgi:hypothetical protein